MKSKGTLISIVIVGYNAERHLSKCLDSICKQTYRDFEVIFVNNGSDDGTGSILKAYPKVRIIHNETNEGFSVANNQGIGIAEGKYVLILNSDVILDEDFLREMIKAAESNNAALFSPKIFNADGKTLDSTGLILSWFYRFFDRGHNEIDRGQYDGKQDIFGPCGAAALYKRDMLEDIKNNGGYFDEDFFFLGEDFDLAWRARDKGWDAAFVPGAICYHVRNSTNFNPKIRQYLSFRNRYFMLIKNRAFGPRYVAVFLLYDIPRFLYAILTNSYTPKAVYEVIKYRRKLKGR